MSKTQSDADAIRQQVARDRGVAEKLEWTLNDLTYKAPEQFTPAMKRRLQSALICSPLTPIIKAQADQIEAFLRGIDSLYILTGEDALSEANGDINALLHTIRHVCADQVLAAVRRRGERDE